MFCPKCATQNLEGASFCRVCGANISLVPQALAGQPVETPVVEETACGTTRRRGRREKEVTLESSFKNIFLGMAFLLISIALSRSIGAGWWFWLLIPAFLMMGTGVAQYIRLKERSKQGSFAAPNSRNSFSQQTSSTPVRGMPQRNTGELLPPPPSVTEGTTRHLGSESQTQHLDAVQPK